ncbi:arginine:ornithine antiporter (APA family) [Breoghania corrubedonensis]|uniref:Arginine-ornithine antiporter n=1 Tax=Breoghania corrubedonensis TaxID=665038 RepID=A0A2T5V8V2_9HYPH|nr:arginine-ornithine antiporter [Breoghania corrubedonensis]PTW60188.1 arginine:ornithine antiporter (APA family) [Breoghania corrubedonensis]
MSNTENINAVADVAVQAEESAGAATSSKSGKLTLLPLVALVVGSELGGGVFNLPHDASAAASPGAIILGWVITGIGVLALALVYQNLSMRKPELNAGPYAYARAGFGDFVGFSSAWGYWISAFLGNVSYAVAIFSALAFFFPVFGAGNNLVSVIGASICLWLLHTLVLRGVREAAFVNVITTIAKLAPLLLFIVLTLLAFNYDKFTFNFWGNATADGFEGLGSVMGQVKSTMLVTLWVFVGIEGASVFSGRAARRSDVGRATVIGFLATLAIYILVSLLSTGVLSQPELAGLKVPAMAYVLEPIAGKWGSGLINLGLVICVGGAFLSWTLLCAEIPYVCGKDGIFPRWFSAENAAGAPVNSLWMTNGLIQIFLILSLFASTAYQFFYSIATVAILPPYLFSGAYALKIALTGESYDENPRGRTKDLVIGLIATVYGVWMLYAAGPSFLLMMTILFAPGMVVYVLARRNAGEHARLFNVWEGLFALALIVAACVAGWLIYQGTISPF